MSTLHVANIKCGGCEATIRKNLEESGLSEIQIERENQLVHFVGDRDIARITLEKLGYPEVGSAAEKALLTKAKSYVSCALGKM